MNPVSSETEIDPKRTQHARHLSRSENDAKEKTQTDDETSSLLPSGHATPNDIRIEVQNLIKLILFDIVAIRNWNSFRFDGTSEAEF